MQFNYVGQRHQKKKKKIGKWVYSAAVATATESIPAIEIDIIVMQLGNLRIIPGKTRTEARAAEKN